MRKVLLIFWLFLCINVFSQEEFKSRPQLKSIEDMLTFAAKQQRKPYRLGAEGPNAFDCSGFTRYCYKQVGIELNRTSENQAKNGKKVSRKKLKDGDLVFFKGERGRGINHVGIVYKVKSGKKFDFIHASSSAGVIISDAGQYEKRYKTARRITTDKKIKNAIKKKK